MHHKRALSRCSGTQRFSENCLYNLCCSMAESQATGQPDMGGAQLSQFKYMVPSDGATLPYRSIADASSPVHRGGDPPPASRRPGPRDTLGTHALQLEQMCYDGLRCDPRRAAPGLLSSGLSMALAHSFLFVSPFKSLGVAPLRWKPTASAAWRSDLAIC